MAKTPGTMTIPVLVRVGSKDIEIGTLTLPVRVVSGQLRPPTERDIKAVLRKARFH